MFFQIFKMAGQVSVGHIQQVFQCVKIQVVVDYQGGHYPQPDLVLECFV